MWQICLCALYNATAETGLMPHTCAFTLATKSSPTGGRSGVLPCLYLYPMVRATLADRVGVYVGWNRERQVRVGRTAVVGLLNG